MQKNIFLGLGSNLTNRADNLLSALSFIASSRRLDIKKISSFYETSPVGPAKRNFYNGVAQVSSNLSPQELLVLIKNIEKALGRKKTLRWGSRIIDIDILFFGNKIITQNDLSIPHKQIQNRLFVLAPLNEIAPNFIDPISKQKIKNLFRTASLNIATQMVKIIS
jgi:2-amino-4-hydroxy-6-hydroxymethyldihydropteridine diphosphokinase